MIRILKYWYLRFWQIVTYFLPDHYFICHLRGWLIKPVLKSSGRKLGLTHDVKLTFPECCDFGDNVFLANGVFILGRGGVIIGNNVSIGPYSVIASAQRNIVSSTTRKQKSKAKPIIIGNDVYMGSHAVIMAGVHIGDNSLISPGVVVSRKIRPKSMVMPLEPKIIKMPSLPSSEDSTKDSS